MDEPDGGVLSHAAFYYRSQPEYAAAIVAFAQTGLAAGEPTMVAVPGANARVIGDRLDDVPGEVVFTDMAELGRNPARIIPRCGRSSTSIGPARAVRRRADLARALGRGDLRGDQARSPAQPRVRAGTDDDFVPIRCLGAAWFRPADARRTHQEASTGATGQTWRDNLPPGCDRPLHPPPAGAEALAYEKGLAPVRRLVAGHAQRAGLDAERTVDLVLAANEIAANTISHTTGSGVLHVWYTSEEIVCQVHDQGEITDPLAGRVRHGPDDRGHGLWLVNKVCDLVELRTGPAGTTVRMHMRLTS